MSIPNCCPLALPGSAFYTVLVHRLAIYAPRFLPTLGHPHAVALRFAHCDQLAAGLEGTRGIESLSLLEARASDIFRHFEELLDAIAKANLTLEPRLNRRGAQWPALLPSNTPREYVEVIHACTTELLNKMAHAYMLRPAIVDCAVDCSTLESTKVAPVRGAKRDVFQYLAANSRLRDSYAVANSLRILIGNLPQQAPPVSY